MLEYKTKLTKREIEILQLIANGEKSKDIAILLFIDLNTVESHRKNIIRKHGAKNIIVVVKEAVKSGEIV